VTPIIQSEQLDLHPISPAVLRALLAGNSCGAGELLGITAPADWDIPSCAIELRLSQLEADPGLQPWLLRAICLRGGPRLLVGHIGFHTAPGAEYLAQLSPGGVEFGFGVLEPWRRKGIATEASEALMRWAREEHQVQRFVLSISPDNAASLGLAAKLGFQKIGSHLDELDGPEDIFERA
jgi:ribosomal-protein-alanine N-acetyltransferase